MNSKKSVNIRISLRNVTGTLHTVKSKVFVAYILNSAKNHNLSSKLLLTQAAESHWLACCWSVAMVFGSVMSSWGRGDGWRWASPLLASDSQAHTNHILSLDRSIHLSLSMLSSIFLLLLIFVSPSEVAKRSRPRSPGGNGFTRLRQLTGECVLFWRNPFTSGITPCSETQV